MSRNQPADGTFVVTCEVSEADLRRRLERDDVRATARIKASIREAMKSHGYDTLRTHRYETGRWDASAHVDDGKLWIAACNHKCEVDALVSLAKAIGVESP